MLTMGSKPRQFDSSTGVRWGLLCSAFMVFCGLINIFVLTASTLENVLYFGLAAFGLLVAAEFKWVWPRLMERSSSRDTTRAE